MATIPNLQKLSTIAEPIVKATGLIIWGIEISNSHRPVVRIFVDSPVPDNLAPGAFSQSSLSQAQKDKNQLLEQLPEQIVAEKNDPELDLNANLANLAMDTNIANSQNIVATISLCESISRHIEIALDVEDYFNDAWVLEVSTPGLDRRFFKISQMLPYLSDFLEVRLTEALNARKVWRGTLEAVANDNFTLQPAAVSEEGEIINQGEPIIIAWSSIQRVVRIYLFKKNTKKSAAKHSAKKNTQKPASKKAD